MLFYSKLSVHSGAVFLIPVFNIDTNKNSTYIIHHLLEAVNGVKFSENRIYQNTIRNVE